MVVASIIIRFLIIEKKDHICRAEMKFMRYEDALKLIK
jgi:hypothetical protein